MERSVVLTKSCYKFILICLICCWEATIKLQYKAMLTILLFSISLLIIMVGGFNYFNNRAAVQSELSSLETFAKELSLHLETHLMEASNIAITLSSAPLIRQSLISSNDEYAQLSETERQDKIGQLNKRWMSSVDPSDSFIISHLSNPVAAFLQQQQKLFPGMYGEIFITNRFGRMIASTGKLTTLAHASKYWWKAAFNHGSGKVFFDDRGFDTSVGGYVLGVVVPIYQAGEIIGLLKANTNILGPIRKLIDNVKVKYDISAKLVRSNGLIVYEKDIEPLSKEINPAFKACVASHVTASHHDSDNGSLVACSPVLVTIESGKFGFGGKGQSIDQLKGNVDETWSVLLSEKTELALAIAHETAKALVIIGLLIVLFAAALAWSLGRIAARPIVMLAEVARAIGKGSLNSRAPEGAKDEIGKLAKSVNRMAENLQATMASRDELKQEIELRKKAEESLRLLSSSVEQAREAISITDSAGTIEYINPAFTKVTGYCPEEAIGKNHNILNSSAQNDSFYKEMWATINNGSAWQGRIVDKAKDGSLYPAMMTISPIFNEAGEITHFVGIQQNLKAYEELEAQLHQSQKMEALGILVGGIAHDFNNKLAGITGNLFLAKTKAVQLPDVLSNLATVEALSFQIAEIIKRLLVFSSKDVVAMEPCDLVSFIREILEAYKLDKPDNISVFHDICTQELLINGELLQLKQMILNLLINAVDALAKAEEPEIKVKVEPFSADAEFSSEHPDLKAVVFAHIMISDNGCGMSDNVKSHLFEPFFTTKGVDTDKGLGLPMVYGAVQLHQGLIKMENNTGPGVSVHIYLPLLCE